jgi:hypothetical protein
MKKIFCDNCDKETQWPKNQLLFKIDPAVDENASKKFKIIVSVVRDDNSSIELCVECVHKVLVGMIEF